MIKLNLQFFGGGSSRGRFPGTQGGRTLIIDDSQFGKKVRKHAVDYGLDPNILENRSLMRNKIEEIFYRPAEVRQGVWRGQGERLSNGTNAEGKVRFYIRDNDVVVTTTGNRFITILKDGLINNPRVQNAEVISP